jgi:cysteine desulfurase
MNQAHRNVYLDHAATTPISERALAAVEDTLRATGNASSLHGAGRHARRLVEESRESIAAAIGARPGEVVFTSGGTEADNLALKGVFWARRDADPRRTRILSTAIEHHAVLDALHWLSAHESAKVELLPVDREGTVDLEALRESIASDPDSVALVSVMWANNEVGTLQPLDEIVAVASPYGIPVHSDAVQAVGAVPVDFAASRLAALTVSAHKLGGPQGVGALVMRRDLDAVPLLHGGGQERDVRSGTLNVAGIVGLAAGLTGSVAGRGEFASRVGGLRDRLVQGVLARAEDAQLNGHPERHLPGLAHFTFPGCEGDSLLMLLDERGIECSTGSACSAGVPQPSHVLLAMGRDDVDARSSLRFSLGRTSTDADVEALLEAIGPVVERGRAAGLVSGFATRRTGA